MNTQKQSYESPQTMVLEVRYESILCESQYMMFGIYDASGEIDDKSVVDGGSF
jgi:hypothetical protein